MVFARADLTGVQVLTVISKGAYTAARVEAGPAELLCSTNRATLLLGLE